MHFAIGFLKKPEKFLRLFMPFAVHRFYYCRFRDHDGKYENFGFWGTISADSASKQTINRQIVLSNKLDVFMEIEK